jgi:hypothetical protein
MKLSSILKMNGNQVRALTNFLDVVLLEKKRLECASGTESDHPTYPGSRRNHRNSMQPVNTDSRGR